MKVACKCKSDFQDSTIGKGNRWGTPVNKSKKDNKVNAYRCTVCRAEHHKFFA